jgi:hypothetical protein
MRSGKTRINKPYVQTVVYPHIFVEHHMKSLRIELFDSKLGAYLVITTTITILMTTTTQ